MKSSSGIIFAKSCIRNSTSCFYYFFFEFLRKHNFRIKPSCPGRAPRDMKIKIGLSTSVIPYKSRLRRDAIRNPAWRISSGGPGYRIKFGMTAKNRRQKSFAILFTYQRQERLLQADDYRLAEGAFRLRHNHLILIQRRRNGNAKIAIGIGTARSDEDPRQPFRGNIVNFNRAVGGALPHTWVSPGFGHPVIFT